MKMRSLFVLICLMILPACSESGASGQSEKLETPYIYILGVAQDAGYPQMLCFKPHCKAGWEDANKRRTAVSLAVISPQENETLLFEAAPQITDQFYRLNNEAPIASNPIAGVFLTHAHMGHYTGLMFFGFEAANAKDLPVYAMPRMKNYLSTNGPWSQLVDFGNIDLKPLEADIAVEPTNGIQVTPFHVPHREEFSEAVGYHIEGPERTALFIPDIDKWQKWERSIIDEIRKVDYALVDATFFNGEELPGRDLSKVPHPSVEESMALFEPLTKEERARVYFIHINHSNPLLDADSEKTKQVRDAGYNVSVEGMRLPL